ncbi:uncharacterized protein LOC144437966 [Glandiceps talaboti]
MSKKIAMVVNELLITKSSQVQKAIMELLIAVCSNVKTRKKMEKQTVCQTVKSIMSATKSDPEVRELCHRFMKLFKSQQVPPSDVPSQKREHQRSKRSVNKQVVRDGVLKYNDEMAKVNHERAKVKQAVTAIETFDDMPGLGGSNDVGLPFSRPQVLWSQRSNLVLLSVRLGGVEDLELQIHQGNVLHFSTIVDDVNYKLDLTLHGDIDKYCYKVCGREVLITLYKQTTKKWPRLLNTKHKVPYVSVDFNRWQDDDSDSDREFFRKTSKFDASFLNDSDGSESDEDSEADEENTYGVDTTKKKVFVDDYHTGLFGSY